MSPGYQDIAINNMDFLVRRCRAKANIAIGRNTHLRGVIGLENQRIGVGGA